MTSDQAPEWGVPVTIPKYDEMTLPVLRFLSDSQPHSTKEIYAKLASDFALSDADLAELLPSGQDNLFRNRVRWALGISGRQA